MYKFIDLLCVDFLKSGLVAIDDVDSELICCLVDIVCIPSISSRSATGDLQALAGAVKATSCKTLQEEVLNAVPELTLHCRQI